MSQAVSDPHRTPAPKQASAEPAEFSVMQPGSTVATALSEGEAAPKHAFMLEINGEMFRTVQTTLETVRPFVFETVRREPWMHLRLGAEAGPKT